MPLIATIVDVSVQTGNQLNIEVLYENKDTGFSRKNVFTIPPTDIVRLSQMSELEALIQGQGKEYDQIDQKKDEIIKLVGAEFTIK